MAWRSSPCRRARDCRPGSIAPSQAPTASVRPADPAASPADDQIGRASCRERVCQYVEISGVAVSLKKHKINNKYYKITTTVNKYNNTNKRSNTGVFIKIK